MDKIDVILTQHLLTDSRLPYRELADRLDLSVNAVHKRIQALTESGIIRTFTAKVSLSALKAVPVLVFGRSEALSVDEVRKKLGDSDSTYWVAVAGGNYLYAGAYLRNIFELEPYVSYVKKEAQMPDPAVGITDSEAGSLFPLTARDSTLDSLDYQVIYALRKNSRKPVSEIAEELGVSAKTVRRRLSRMISQRSIDLSLEWYPDASNDIMTVFHLNVKPYVDKTEVGRLLTERYSPNVLFFWSFSNLPNLLLCVVWTNTMKELQDIRKGFQIEAFESVVPNVLYGGYIFDTWRDRLVVERGVPPASNDRLKS